MTSNYSDPFDSIFDDFAKLGAEAFNNMQKSPTPSDEDLAKMFYEYARKHGVPRMPEGAYGSGEPGSFDDLTMRDIRAMANFVKEMRK